MCWCAPRSGWPAGFPYGAAHESEIQYLFRYTGAPYPATLPASQQDLAASMRNSWLAFARSGRPAAPGDS
jgi:para-nitrobenzyl esterase